MGEVRLQILNPRNINTLNTFYAFCHKRLQRDRTEWSAPQQSEFSHGKLQSTKKLAPNYYEQREFTIMMTPKQKYLQHSYSIVSLLSR